METEHIDTRKLEPAAREQLRRLAIRLHRRGHTQVAVAEELGLRRATVGSWIKKAMAGESPKEKRRGRSTGSGRHLTQAQEERIRRDIVDKTPDQYKLPFALWNARAVQALIKQYFAHAMPIRTVRLYLKRWGFTPQRPLKRALEQKPEAVKHWLETEYPAIVARSKAEDAEIHWGDETAVSSVEHYPRGYAPEGQTPVLPLVPVLVLSQSKRHRTNLISSITNQGTMRFMVHKNTLTATTLIKFLERLVKDSRRKVFLVLDNLRVHHSRKVRQWLEKNVERIELFFLPSYSPELNPDEYLNADLKARMSAGEPAHRPEELKKKCFPICALCKSSLGVFNHIS